MDKKLLIVLSFPLMIDFVTCFLQMRNNRKLSGPSGLPVVTLFIYGIFIFYGPISLFKKILMMLLSVVVHVVVVFLIPYVDLKIIENKKNKPS